MKKIIISILILLSASGVVNAQSKFKQDIERLIKLYSGMAVGVQQYYYVNDTALFFYDSYQKRLDHKKDYEFFISEKEFNKSFHQVKLWDSASVHSLYNERKFNSPIDISKPLKGYKIALDPGHISANIEQAKFENKYLQFKANPAVGLNEDIEIIEANSTLATAKLLKKKLEEAGAEVYMTRTMAGVSSSGKTFEQWYNEKYATSKKQPGKTNVYSNDFNNEDLKNRARLINAYHPDVTVIIHFNVDEKNVPWKKPTGKNFNMIFVGDADQTFQLDTKEKRIAFLQTLLNDPYHRSRELGGALLNSFERNLQIEIADQEDATYLSEKSKKTSVRGVYERNLALTRMIKGTVVYGETLYQDNIKECVMLNKKEFEIDGIKYSARIKQVADAYYEGIINYFSK